MELEVKYAKLVEAYEKKDVGMFMEDKTPDFTVRLLYGTIVTRDQVEEAVRHRLDRIKTVNFLKIKIGNITVTGDEAVVTTVQEFSRVIVDPHGNEHTVESSGTTRRDTWVRTAHGWSIKKVEEIS